MTYVCSGENCPRRFVCKTADVQLVPCGILYWNCSEKNNWEHFVPNDATVESLNTWKRAVQLSYEKRIQQINSAIGFLMEDIPQEYFEAGGK